MHLTAAREHPAAVVKKQQERDVAALLPSIGHLTERQHQLFFLIHSVIARHKPDTFSRLLDEDVAQASAAVAATLETAGKGVLYEHTPASLVAQRLAKDITAMLAEVKSHGTKIYDGEVAIALRAIERGAREAHRQQAEDTAYLSLVGRLLHVRNQPAPEEPDGQFPDPAVSLLQYGVCAPGQARRRVKLDGFTGRNVAPVQSETEIWRSDVRCATRVLRSGGPCLTHTTSVPGGSNPTCRRCAPS